MKPLDGITVIDLTTYVAAPVCARLLGELGARVIKIEAPKGDNWRNTSIGFAPHRFTQVENPVFDIYNSGKDMICLNLKNEEGMSIMHQLLSGADVFITNNRPAALERLGLHYDQLKEKYPRLVYGIVLGFGEKGPEADKPAFDTTAFWSRSGFLRDTAVKNRDYYPVEAPSGVGDSYTGTNLAMQVLAALLQRQQTGKGQYVKSALFHIGAFAMASMTVKGQRPFGDPMPLTRWDARPAVGAYRCADDEWIFLSGITPAKLGEMCGRPEVMKDPIWDPANLSNTRKERWSVMQEMMLTKTSDEWMKLFEPLGTPTVRMAHFADVSEDEQAWANGYVEKVEYANGNADVVPSIPLDMECLERGKTQPTRRLGQDTARVLSELGYTDEQVAALAADGVIIS